MSAYFFAYQIWCIQSFLPGFPQSFAHVVENFLPFFMYLFQELPKVSYFSGGDTTPAAASPRQIPRPLFPRAYHQIHLSASPLTLISRHKSIPPAPKNRLPASLPAPLCPAPQISRRPVPQCLRLCAGLPFSALFPALPVLRPFCPPAPTEIFPPHKRA